MHVRGSWAPGFSLGAGLLPTVTYPWYPSPPCSSRAPHPFCLVPYPFSGVPSTRHPHPFSPAPPHPFSLVPSLRPRPGPGTRGPGGAPWVRPSGLLTNPSLLGPLPASLIWKRPLLASFPPWGSNTPSWIRLERRGRRHSVRPSHIPPGRAREPPFKPSSPSS